MKKTCLKKRLWWNTIFSLRSLSCLPTRWMCHIS